MKNVEWAPRSAASYRSLVNVTKRALALVIENAHESERVPEKMALYVSLASDGEGYGAEYKLVSDWEQAIRSKRDQIRNLPEFEQCLEQLSTDYHIDEEAAGNPLMYRSSDIGTSVIFPFVEEMVRTTGTPSFDRTAFNRRYKLLEDLLCSPTYRVTTWSSLKNFKSSMENLPLTDSLRIRKLSQLEQEHRLSQVLSGADSTSTFEVLSTPFIIEAECTVPKDRMDEMRYGEESSLAAFGQTLTALRLFKAGAVGIGRTHFLQPYWPGVMTSTRQPSPECSLGRPAGRTYDLTEAEAADFAKFHHWLAAIRPTSRFPLEVALRRFNLAYGSRLLEDRLIDFMISFESALLTENQELSLRLSLRTANLLRQRRARKAVSAKMRHAYDLRSRIVHGKPVGTDELETCVGDVEELLRLSLLALLALAETGHRKADVLKQLVDDTFGRAQKPCR